MIDRQTDRNICKAPEEESDTTVPGKEAKRRLWNVREEITADAGLDEECGCSQWAKRVGCDGMEWVLCPVRRRGQGGGTGRGVAAWGAARTGNRVPNTWDLVFILRNAW